MDDFKPVRLPKDEALQFAIKFSSLYTELFVELKASGERVVLTDRFTLMRQRIGSYVQLYDDENRIGVAMFIGILGEEQLKELNEESKRWTPEERLDFLRSCTDEKAIDEIVERLGVPETEDDWQAAEEAAAKLSPSELTEAARRGAALFGATFAHIFNVLSLMTHGCKLTTLVSLAKRGDREAFLRAVQVDRVLLTHHPFFISQKQSALDSGDKADRLFLSRLAAHEMKPQLRGRVRYPGLYFLFHTLESVGWLSDLTDVELLDACDEAGLDRWQNRIEDVGYMTKRRLEYMRWHKKVSIVNAVTIPSDCMA